MPDLALPGATRHFSSAPDDQCSWCPIVFCVANPGKRPDGQVQDHCGVLGSISGEHVDERSSGSSDVSQFEKSLRSCSPSV